MDVLLRPQSITFCLKRRSFHFVLSSKIVRVCGAAKWSKWLPPSVLTLVLVVIVDK